MDPITIKIVVLAVIMLGVGSSIIYSNRKATHDDSHNLAVGEVIEVGREFLAAKPKDDSFCVFLIHQIVGDDENAAFTQISIEHGRPGVDHVYTAQKNQETEDPFRDLASQNGLTVLELEVNGVRYHRVEPEDPTLFAQKVLKEVFGLSESDQVEAIYG